MKLLVEFQTLKHLYLRPGLVSDSIGLYEKTLKAEDSELMGIEAFHRHVHKHDNEKKIMLYYS